MSIDDRIYTDDQGGIVDKDETQIKARLNFIAGAIASKSPFVRGTT